MAVGASLTAQRSWDSFALRPDEVALVYRGFVNAAQQFRLAGQPARATIIERALFRFDSTLRDIERDVARLADQEIKRNIDRTRVRPDTARGGTKLRSQIVSKPLGSRPSVAGVYIALLDELDKVVGRTASRKPYWPAQEYGRDDVTLPHGVFTGPGYSRPYAAPDPMRRREHPLFRPRGRRGGQKDFPASPIQARHFLRDGRDTAYKEWSRRVQVAQAQLAREVRLAVVGPQAAAKRPGGPRPPRRP